MTVHALIPFGAVERAKTRLGAFLSPVQRQTLAVVMLMDVIGVLQTTSSVDSIAVIGPLTNRKLFALPAGVRSILEGKPSLNGAVAMAVRAIPAGDSVLVIHADLPLLDAGDIDAFVRATPADGVSLAKSADGGTPAICSHIGTTWQWQFGPRSFFLHRDAASKAGIPYVVDDSSSLTIDVDTPEDLLGLDPALCGPQTAAFLQTVTRTYTPKPRRPE